MSLYTPQKPKRFFKLIAVLFIPAAVIIAIVIYISNRSGYPIAFYTRDPSSISATDPFFGFLSNVGVILWSSTVAVCLFSCSFLRRLGILKDHVRFFLLFGVLTSMLLFDDLFQFHEEIFPALFHVSKNFVFLIYGVAVVAILARTQRVILRTEYLLLVISFGFFGASMGMHLISDEIIPLHYLYEDGAKFLGIVAWMGYLVGTAHETLYPSDTTFESLEPVHQKVRVSR